METINRIYLEISKQKASRGVNGGAEMRYWECKCGKLQAFGSDAPAECMGCSSCGTNCYKKEPLDHIWITRYNGATVTPYLICNRCSEKKESKQPANDLLEACKVAYRKHRLNDDSIGWDELSDILLNALCNEMGDVGFQEWLRQVKRGKVNERTIRMP